MKMKINEVGQTRIILFRYLMIGVVNILWVSNALAECRDTSCTETNAYVHNMSTIKPIESVAKSVIDRCVVSNRKPLRLHQDHPLFEQVRQQYPAATNSGERLQMVLNENADPCEITYVVLVLH